MPNLTDLSVKSLGPGLYYDSRLPAFGIRVGKHRRTWLVVRTQKRLKVTLGHYPTMSLQEARKKAMLVMSTPARQQTQISFPDALDLFLAQPRWRDHSKRVLKSNLRYFSWKRPLSKISHEDVAAIVDAIEAPSARAHALKDIRNFFNWCVPRYLSASPCVGLKMEPQPSRDRVLSHDELVRVWHAAATMGYPFGTIVQLLIVTGQRKTEVGSLRWDSVRTDTVVLPAAITKNGREHTFPLGELGRSLLPAKATGFVFRATGSEAAYNGYTHHLKLLQKASDTKAWTLHDLRRTFATNLAALGVPIHVTEKLLNHVSGTLSGVAAIYNRHTYQDEMRAAVALWEKELLRLTRAKGEGPSST